MLPNTSQQNQKLQRNNEPIDIYHWTLGLINKTNELNKDKGFFTEEDEEQIINDFVIVTADVINNSSRLFYKPDTPNTELYSKYEVEDFEGLYRFADMIYSRANMYAEQMGGKKKNLPDNILYKQLSEKLDYRDATFGYNYIDQSAPSESPGFQYGKMVQTPEEIASLRPSVKSEGYLRDLEKWRKGGDPLNDLPATASELAVIAYAIKHAIPPIPVKAMTYDPITGMPTWEIRNMSTSQLQSELKSMYGSPEIHDVGYWKGFGKGTYNMIIPRTISMAGSAGENIGNLANYAIRDKARGSDRDKSFSYFLQNLAAVMSAQRSYQARDDRWHSNENLGFSMGETAAQTITQLFIGFTGSPALSYLYGSLLVGDMFNQEMKEAGVPYDQRFPIYLGVTSATFCVEHLLGQALGLDIFVQKLSRKKILEEAVRKGTLGHLADAGFSVGDIGKSAKDTKLISRIINTTNPKSIYNYTKDAYKSGALKRGSIEVLIKSSEESVEEGVENVFHEGISTIYNYFNMPDIEEEHAKAEKLGVAPKRFYLGDYDPKVSAFRNWGKNVFSEETLVEMGHGFFGGFSHAVVGSFTVNNYLKRKQQKLDNINYSMQLLYHYKGDIKAIERDLTKIYKSEKKLFGKTWTDGNEIIYPNETDKRSQADIVFDILLDDLRSAKQIYDDLNLDNFKTSGILQQDSYFVDEYLDALKKYNTLLQTKEEMMEEQKGKEMSKEMQEKIDNMDKEIEEVKQDILDYTTIEEGTNFSKKANERVKSFHINKLKAEEHVKNLSKEDLRDRLKNFKLKNNDIGIKQLIDYLATINTVALNKTYATIKEIFSMLKDTHTVVNSLSEQYIKAIQQYEGAIDFNTVFESFMKDIENIFSKDISRGDININSIKQTVKSIDNLIDVIQNSIMKEGYARPSEFGVSENVNEVIKKRDELLEKYKNNPKEFTDEDSEVLSSLTKDAYLNKILGELQKVNTLSFFKNKVLGDNLFIINKNAPEGNDVLNKLISDNENAKIEYNENDERNTENVKYGTISDGVTTIEFAEYDSQVVSLGETVLLNFEVELRKIQDELYTKDGDVNKSASAASILKSINILESLESIHDDKIRFMLAMEAVNNGFKKGEIGYDTDEETGIRTRNFIEDYIFDSNRRNIENKAEATVNERMAKLKDRLDKMRQDANSVENFKNMAAKSMSDRAAVMNFAVVYRLIGDINHASYKLLEEAGIPVIKYINNLTNPNLSLENIKKRIEAISQNPNDIIDLDEELVKDINTVVESFMDNVYEAYNNSTDKSKDNIKKVIRQTIEGEFEREYMIGEGQERHASLNGSYFTNNVIHDILNRKEQGLNRDLGEGIERLFTNSLKPNQYNAMYHHVVNMFHRMINIKASDVRNVLTKINETLSEESDIMPTTEQMINEKDIINILQTKKEIDQYVFDVDAELTKYLPEIMFRSENDEPLTLEQFKERIKNTKDAGLKKDLQERLEIFENRGFVDVNGKGSYFFKNGAVVLGNSGSGKTALSGLHVLAYALLNAKSTVNVALVGISQEGIKRLASEVNKLIEAYNKNIDPKQRKTIKVNIKQITTQDALKVDAKRKTSIFEGNDMVIWDEAGKLSSNVSKYSNNIKLFSHIENIHNDLAKSNKIIPILFMGDTQQARSDQIAESTRSLRIQKHAVNTMPYQYSFRTNNNVIDKLRSYWGIKALFSASAYSNPMYESKMPPRVTVQIFDGKKHGARYYNSVDDVIKAFISDSKNDKTSTKALIFYNDNEADNYIKNIPKELRDNIYIINSNPAETSKYKIMQGLDIEDAYIAIDPNDEKVYINGEKKRADKTYRFTTLSTAVTRSKNYVAMVGEVAHNEDDISDFKARKQLSKEEKIEKNNITRDDVNKMLAVDEKDKEEFGFIGEKKAEDVLKKKEDVKKEPKKKSAEQTDETINVEETPETEETDITEDDSDLTKQEEAKKKLEGDTINDTDINHAETDDNKEDKSFTSTNVESKYYDEMSNNNVPIRQGMVFTEEIEKLQSIEPDRHLAIAKIYNARFYAMQSILNSSYNKDAIKINMVKKNTTQLVIDNNGKIVEDEVTIENSIVISVSLDYISKANDLTPEQKEVLEALKTSDGWVEVAWVNVNHKTNAEQKLIKNKFSKETIYKLSDFKKMIHVESNKVSFLKASVVPASLLNGIEVTGRHDSKGYNGTLGDVNVQLHTMTIDQKMNTDRNFIDNIKEDAERLLDVQIGEDGRISDDNINDIKDNLVKRIAQASEINRSEVSKYMGDRPTEYNTESKSISDNLQYYKEFAKGLLEAIENVVSRQTIFVPAYNKHGGLDASNMRANVYGIGTDIFINRSFFDDVTDEAANKKSNEREDSNAKFKKVDTIDLVEFDNKAREEAISMIGDKAYEGISFVNVESIADGIAGYLKNGRITIYTVGNRIQKGVLRHEIFHNVFEHGITLTSQEKVTRDFVESNWHREEIREMYESGDIVGIKEAMANTFETLTQISKAKPTTLWGKFVHFLNNLIDRITSLFTNYTNVDTFEQLVTNIHEGRYANRLDLNHETYVYETLFKDNHDTLAEANVIDSQDSVFDEPYGDDIDADTCSRVRNMFSNASEESQMIRFTKSIVIDNTIYNQSNSDVRHLKMKDAIESFRNNILAFYSSHTLEGRFEIPIEVNGNQIDLRDLNASEYRSVRNQIEYTPTEYLYAIISGYDLSVEDINNRIDDIVDVVFPNINRMSQSNIQYIDHSMLSVSETIPNALRQVMTSLSTIDFKLQREGNKWVKTSNKYAGNVRMVSDKHIQLAGKHLGRALKTTHKHLMGNDIETMLKGIAEIIEDYGYTHASASNISYANDTANDILTLADYIAGEDNPNSLLSKIQNADVQEKTELINFVSAFLSNYSNISDVSFVKQGSKYIHILKTDVVDTIKKNLKNAIKRSIFDKGIYKKRLVNSFADILANAPFYINRVNGNIEFVARTNNGDFVIATVFDTKKGLASFSDLKTDSPATLNHSIKKFLGMIGVYTTNNSIDILVNDANLMAKEIQDMSKISLYDNANAMPFILTAHLMSLEVGTNFQYLHDALSSFDMSGAIDALVTINQNIFKGKKKLSNIDKLKDAILTALDKMVLTNTDKMRLQEIASSKDTDHIRERMEISKKLTSDKVNALKKNLDVFINSANDYMNILEFFKGKEYIDEMRHYETLPEEEAEFLSGAEVMQYNEVRRNGIMASPLNLDITLPIFHRASQGVSSVPEQARSGANTYSQTRNGSYIDHVLHALKNKKDALLNDKPEYNNNLFKNKYALIDYGSILEYKIGRQLTNDMSTPDMLVAYLDAFAKGVHNNDMILHGMPRGDANKALLYYVYNQQKGNILNIAMHNINKTKASDVVIKQAYTNMFKDILHVYTNYHTDHIESVNRFKNMMLDVFLNLDNLNMSSTQLSIITQALLNIDNKLDGISNDLEGIKNYDYTSVVESVYQVFDVINELNLDNPFELLTSFGMYKNNDVKFSRDKVNIHKGILSPGNSLTFNMERKYRIRKQARQELVTDELGKEAVIDVYDEIEIPYMKPTDAAFNGKILYRHKDFVQSKKEYVKDKPMEYVSQKSLADIDINNLSEMQEVMNQMYLYNMYKLQAYIMYNINAYHNLSQDVVNLLSVDGTLVPFQTRLADGTEVSNHAMKLYYMQSQLSNRSLAEIMHGDLFSYKDVNDFYTRSKMTDTPGSVAVASPIGLGTSFKVIPINDKFIKVPVKKLNMLTNEFESVDEVIAITDGVSIMPAVSSVFIRNSFGGEFSGITGDMEKSIVTDNNTLTGMTNIKHATKQITSEDVLHNPQLASIEYRALYHLDVDVADNFMNNFNNNIDKGFNAKEAFEMAIKDAVHEIQTKREEGTLDINNLIGFFAHPSGLKTFKGATNNVTIDNVEGLVGIDGFNTLDISTESFRSIFNADSEVAGSDGEVLMKHLYHQAKGLASPELSTKIEKLYNDVLRKQLAKLKIELDGSIGEENDKKIMDNVIKKVDSGLIQTGSSNLLSNLIMEVIKNPKYINVPNINTKVKQTLYKYLNDRTSKLRFRGAKYNQMSDVLLDMYNITITRPDGSVVNTVATYHGLNTLINMFGKNNVDFTSRRDGGDYSSQLNNMVSDENGYTPGECILQPTWLSDFGIQKGMYLNDYLWITANINGNDITFSVNEIDNDGVLRLVDSKGKVIVEHNVFDDNGHIINLVASNLINNNESIRNFDNQKDMVMRFKDALKVLLVRKPTPNINHANYNMLVEILHESNTANISPKKNATDDSDHDIDALYSSEKSNKRDYISQQYNQLIDAIEEVFAEAGKKGMLDVSTPADMLNTLAEDGGIMSTGDMRSAIGITEQNYNGDKSISRFANIQETTSILSTLSHQKEKRDLVFNDNYKGNYTLAHSILSEFLHNGIDYRDVIINAIMLQASVDTGKDNIFGRIGVSRAATNELLAMRIYGWNMKEITDFMKNPIVKRIYRRLEAADSLTGRNDITSLFMLVSQDIGDRKINYDLVSEEDREAMKSAFDNYTNTVNRRIQRENRQQSVTSDDVALDDVQDMMNEAYNIESLKREEQLANDYVLMMLEQFSLVGEIIKETTFAIDIADGIASKDFEVNSRENILTFAFSKDFNEINFGIDESIIPHTEEAVKEHIEFHKRYNNNYKNLDNKLKNAFLTMQAEKFKMFKLGNFILTNPQLTLYSTLYKAKNNILASQMIFEGTNVKAKLDRAALRLGYGLNLNKTQFYTIREALQRTMMSDALNDYINTKYPNGVDLSIVRIEEGKLIADEFNSVYNNLDLTNVLQGRHLFIKRFSSYAMALNSVINQWYTNKTNGAENASVENVLKDVYRFTDEDLNNLYDVMRIYNGRSVFNIIVEIGSQYDSILSIKDAKQLRDNPTLYNEVKQLFEALPEFTKDMFSAYEVLINGPSIRNNSLYDIMSTDILKEITDRFDNNTIDNIDDYAFVNNVAKTDRMIFANPNQQSQEYINELKAIMDENGFESVILRVYTKDAINNTKVHLAEVFRKDLDKEGITFDDAKVLIFNSASKNVLGYSADTHYNGYNMSMLNLDESEIHDLLKYGTAKITFLSGHNYVSDRALANKYNIAGGFTYQTNAGVPVRVSKITPTSITIQQVNLGSMDVASLPTGIETQVSERKGAMNIGDVKNNIESISNSHKDSWVINEETNRYVNKDLRLQANRVTTVTDKVLNLSEEQKQRAIDSRKQGTVQDAITKLVLNNYFNPNIETEILLENNKGESVAGNTFLKAYKDAYSKNIANGEDHPLSAFNDKQIARVGRLFAERVYKSPRTKALFTTIFGTENLGKVSDFAIVSDIRVKTTIQDKPIMGELDVALIRKKGNTLYHTIIDIKTTKNIKQYSESLFNQTTLYSMGLTEMINSNLSSMHLFRVSKISEFIEAHDIRPGANNDIEYKLSSLQDVTNVPKFVKGADYKNIKSNIETKVSENANLISKDFNNVNDDDIIKYC